MTGQLAAVSTGLLVVPVFENDGAEDLEDLDGLDAATGGEWSRALTARELTGKPFETLIVPVHDGWGAARVMFIGAGPAGSFTHETAGRLGGAAALLARQRRVTRLALLLRPVRTTTGPAAEVNRLVQATAEGLVLGQLEPAVHKSGASDIRPLESADIVLEGTHRTATLQAAADRGRVLGECSNVARVLANEPSNVLTPRSLPIAPRHIAAAPA